MASPLAGSLAATINSAMSSLFLDAVYTVDVPGVSSPDVDSFDPPAPVPTDYPCKAIVENYSERFRLDGTVKQTDRKVLILARSLSVKPEIGGRVTIGGITFTAIDVATDPATAAWEVQGRF